MSEPAEEAAASVRAARGTEVDQLQRFFGISRHSAQQLADAGYSSRDVLQRLTDPGLEELGLDAGDVERIRTLREASTAEPPPAPEAKPAAAPADPEAGNKIVERWADSVRKAERPRRRPVTAPDKDSAEVLRKWVQGDDGALESWIQASDTFEPTPGPVPEAGARPGEGTSPGAAGLAGAGAGADAVVEQLREREQTVIRWLTELLDRVKTDQFDPHSLLEEAGESQRQLFEEKARRKQLEEELEHVKRGSVAVIKYVRSREAKAREQALQSKDAEIAELRLKLLSTGNGLEPGSELPDSGPDAPSGSEAPADPGASVPESKVREVERQLRDEYDGRQQEFVERETELRRRIVQLEGDVRAARAAEAALRERSGIVTGSAEEISGAIQSQLKEMDGRERDLIIRENELRSKFEEIRLAAEELERKREPIGEREKELAQWEAQLQTHRQALELETRKLDQARSEVENSAETRLQAAEAARLKELQNQLLHKEAELKAREAFVQQRTEEMEALQRQAVLGEGQEPAALGGPGPAGADKRIKSGVRRLDDLLFGGYQPASQILVNGPAHTGKDVLARMFVAEGLKAGIPAVWVVTDKTYLQIREEMVALLPTYGEFEQKGMVRYVDLYARSLGVTQAEPGVRLLSPTDKAILDQLTAAVNNASGEFKDKAATYRLVFESVSTVSAYLDTTAMFRFLQPFAGRRKLDRAAAYYLLETGMHSESDLQALEHMMDGSVNLKVEQLKTFLSVKGLGETQSRAWIGYTFTKKSFSLGSFSLDHIR